MQRCQRNLRIGMDTLDTSGSDRFILMWKYLAAHKISTIEEVSSAIGQKVLSNIGRCPV